MTRSRTVGARRLDTTVTAAVLAAEGTGREAALLRLRAFLLAVAWFEVDRRRDEIAALSFPEIARLVRDSAEAAYAALLSRLGDYRGQSRFAVWAAKFVIHETAAAARETSTERRKADACRDTNAGARNGERATYD